MCVGRAAAECGREHEKSSSTRVQIDVCQRRSPVPAHQSAQATAWKVAQTASQGRPASRVARRCRRGGGVARRGEQPEVRGRDDFEHLDVELGVVGVDELAAFLEELLELFHAQGHAGVHHLTTEGGEKGRQWEGRREGAEELGGGRLAKGGNGWRRNARVASRWIQPSVQGDQLWRVLRPYRGALKT